MGHMQWLRPACGSPAMPWQQSPPLAGRCRSRHRKSPAHIGQVWSLQAGRRWQPTKHWWVMCAAGTAQDCCSGMTERTEAASCAHARGGCLSAPSCMPQMSKPQLYTCKPAGTHCIPEHDMLFWLCLLPVCLLLLYCLHAGAGSLPMRHCPHPPIRQPAPASFRTTLTTSRFVTCFKARALPTHQPWAHTFATARGSCQGRVMSTSKAATQPFVCANRLRWQPHYRTGKAQSTPDDPRPPDDCCDRLRACVASMPHDQWHKEGQLHVLQQTMVVLANRLL